MRRKIEESIGKVRRWVERNEYRGYDPADGNASFLHALTFGNVFLQRVLQQAVLRAPFNIRPLVGVPRQESTKGRGYMAWGYIEMFKEMSDVQYRRLAKECLGWLMQNRARTYTQYCWGNHFNYATRSGKLPRFEPTIVWSSLIGEAFLEAYEVFGNKEYLDITLSVCDWILQLPRERTKAGSCLSYVAFRQNSIHNSNMLGAALLARASCHARIEGAVETACESMLYSCSRQRRDGAWFYGESPTYRWVDNFHTGYNLDSLRRYIKCTGDKQFEKNLRGGLTYYKEHFFEPDGRPRYYDSRTYPIDIQSAAQAIETLGSISNQDPESLLLACRVAEWTIDNMQAPDGHFYYRDLGWTKVKTPMIHWGQATMFKALAVLLSRLAR